MSADAAQPGGAPGEPAGLVLVDKPTDWTSHDVVARLRRLAGTKHVGHAGTLDPAATGLLIAGVGRATRLLTYLVGLDKTYEATIRLGAATLTDDAEGEATSLAAPGAVAALTRARVAQAVVALTGEILQAPSAVSAIKVNGRRAYARVRSGEAVKLAPRPVTVASFDILDARRGLGPVGGAPMDPAEAAAGGRRRGRGRGHVSGASGAAAASEPVPEPAPARPAPVTEWLDLDVRVQVSSGTYVRALARDLGQALGVGGHLVALRRTAVGPFRVSEALTLEQLAESFRLWDMGAAARRLFPVLELDPAEAGDVAHGRPIPFVPTRLAFPPGFAPASAAPPRPATPQATATPAAVPASASPPRQATPQVTAPPAAVPASSADPAAREAKPGRAAIAALGRDGTLVAILVPDPRRAGRLRPAAVFAPAV
ncbi:MAG: tRNA pseudouridine(55) synthase TruB [Bifidobacteriaceae bacterium]|nr:tRNA pseudouridine(55) synthase TruB [Bifidobacteriaceae bacterium]